MNNLLVRNIGTLTGIIEGPHHFKKGEALSILNSLKNAYLFCENGRIKAYGSMNDELPTNASQIIDANGGYIIPSWCDSHTHIVFASSREQEFVDRINGLTYEEIAKRGGGILNSATKLRQASFDDLLESAWDRLNEVIRCGTGAIEIKSGYGLSLESELKMLKVIAQLKKMSPIDIKATFLGAHAIPKEFRQRRKEYIHLIINKMIPEVADQQLADYCDVFCDRGFFTPEETENIIVAAAKFGMKSKIHANELGLTGGVQVGVKNGALSVDHLECMGDEEIDCLKESDTIPTLLPGTAFFLNMEYAPARRMIDSGLGVALASDYNPGSTPSGNMPFVLSLSCLKLNMLPEEAINAATINGAFAMEMENDCGSITVGKQANFILTKKIPSLAYIPYAFGSNHIEKVFIKGKPI